MTETKASHIETNRLFWIDWLRFLAAFVVVFCHIRGGHFVEYGSLDPGSQNIFTILFFSASRLGHESVIMFFSLSGMLVGGKLIEKVISGNLILTNFFIDRLFRIYVPYFPILMISGLISGQNFDGQIFLVNLAGLQGVYGGVFVGNNSLWSLSYEIWFYILAGSTASFIFPRKSIFKTILFLIVLILAASIYLKLEMVYLLCFFVSSILHFLKVCRIHKLAILILSSIACFSMCAISQLASESISIDLNSLKLYCPDKNTITIILCVLICIVIKSASLFTPNSYFTRYIEKIGVFAASFSYTLYLCHLPILYFLNKIGFFSSEKVNVVNTYSIFIVCYKFLFVIVISYILYYLFEKNTGYLKNNFKSKFNIT